jgi:hypothetical protein
LTRESVSGRRRQGETVLKNGDSTAKGVLYPETLFRVNYKKILRVFQTIVVYRVIVDSLVTSL